MVHVLNQQQAMVYVLNQQQLDCFNNVLSDLKGFLGRHCLVKDVANLSERDGMVRLRVYNRIVLYSLGSYSIVNAFSILSFMNKDTIEEFESIIYNCLSRIQDEVPIGIQEVEFPIKGFSTGEMSESKIEKGAYSVKLG